MPSALSVLKYKYSRSVTIILMLILAFSNFHKMYTLLIMSERSSVESFVKAKPLDSDASKLLNCFLFTVGALY
jgi:hypothetical protein